MDPEAADFNLPLPEGTIAIMPSSYTARTLAAAYYKANLRPNGVDAYGAPKPGGQQQQSGPVVQQQLATAAASGPQEQQQQPAPMPQQQPAFAPVAGGPARCQADLNALPACTSPAFGVPASARSFGPCASRDFRQGDASGFAAWQQSGAAQAAWRQRQQQQQAEAAAAADDSDRALGAWVREQRSHRCPFPAGDQERRNREALQRSLGSATHPWGAAVGQQPAGSGDAPVQPPVMQPPAVAPPDGLEAYVHAAATGEPGRGCHQGQGEGQACLPQPMGKPASPGVRPLMG